MFTFELQRRLTRAGSGVRSMAAHPGLSKTNLARHVTGPKGLGLKILATFAQDGELWRDLPPGSTAPARPAVRHPRPGSYAVT